MPQYMLILGGVDRAKKIGQSKEHEAIMAKYMEWTQNLVDSKKLVDAHKLKDYEGRRLVFKNGDVVDGLM